MAIERSVASGLIAVPPSRCIGCNPTRNLYCAQWNVANRREAVVADRHLGRLKWAESAPTGVAQRTAGIGRRPGIGRYRVSPFSDDRDTLGDGPPSQGTFGDPDPHALRSGRGRASRDGHVSFREHRERWPYTAGMVVRPLPAAKGGADRKRRRRRPEADMALITNF